jgi:hypothetical protein
VLLASCDTITAISNQILPVYFHVEEDVGLVPEQSFYKRACDLVTDKATLADLKLLADIRSADIDNELKEHALNDAQADRRHARLRFAATSFVPLGALLITTITLIIQLVTHTLKADTADCPHLLKQISEGYAARNPLTRYTKALY